MSKHDNRGQRSEVRGSDSPAGQARGGGAWRLVLLVMVSLSAGAGEEAVRNITLPECVELALENNLDLQIEQITRRIAERESLAARGGYDPTLSLAAERRREESLGAQGEEGRLRSESDADTWRTSVSGATSLGGLRYELGGRLGESSGIRESNPFDTSSGSAGLTLTQPLLKGFRTDDVRTRVNIADQQSAEAAIQLEGRLQEVVGQVETAWYALIQAREAIRVQEEAVRLATRPYEDNRRRVQIGSLSVLDEKQAETQAAAARADLSSAKRTYAEAQNRLKALLFANHRVYRAETLVPIGDLQADPVAVDAVISGDRALENRPDLRQARMALERQGLTVDLQRNQVLPSLELVGSAGWVASSEDDYSGSLDRIGSGDEPYWSLGATFSVPLGNRTARQRFRQSRDTADKMRLQLRQSEEYALVEVDNAVAAVETGFERVQATREAREYAEEALAAEQRKLDSGRSTSFVVLQLQRDLTSARNAEIQALADYNRQLSTLALAEGSLLERHGIEIEP